MVSSVGGVVWFWRKVGGKFICIYKEIENPQRIEILSRQVRDYRGKDIIAN